MLRFCFDKNRPKFKWTRKIIFSELLIPPTANVYYAVSTQHDLNFVLREKHEDINDCLGQDTSVVDPLHTSTPKSGPRKGSRDTSKARRKLLGLQLWTSFSQI